METDMTFLPMLTVVDNDKPIKEFDSYTDLYLWSTTEGKKAISWATASASLILLFGECPLKLDLGKNKLYHATTPYAETAEWKELNNLKEAIEHELSEKDSTATS